MVLQVSPDVELATLRELPFTRPGFIDAANPLYQLEPPSDAELQVVTPLCRGLYCVDCSAGDPPDPAESDHTHQVSRLRRLRGGV